jgi:ligand-binding sensor domain-containing protein
LNSLENVAIGCQSRLTFKGMKHASPIAISSQYILAFLLISALLACQEPKQPVPNGPVTATTTQATMPATEPADPNFGPPGDTFSTQGPRQITRSVLLDKNGNLWFGSWEGILRYDGKQFTNYTLKAGLRHFHVFSAFEDQAGNLWFGTIGGGLYRFDGQAFTLFTTADGLAGNSVNCMLEDNLGNLWLGTNEGLSRYDGHTFTNYTTELGLVSPFINALMQDKQGNLWIGSQNGLCRYDGNAFTNFTKRKGLAFYNIRDLKLGPNGIVWIGSEDGLYRYDGQTLEQLSANYTGNLMVDKSGKLWLSEIKPNSKGMTLSQYDGKTFRSLANHTQVFGMAEDRDGNVWFGTEKGVERYKL